MPRDHRSAPLADAQVEAGLTQASQSAAPVERTRRARRRRSELHDRRLRERAQEAERASAKTFLDGVFPYSHDRADGAARAFSLLGERWNLAILNEFADGPLRSAELQRRLEIPGPTLRLRLKTLVAEGLLERRPYSTRPPRFEYRLTALGWDLYPALAHIAGWGENALAAAATKPLSGWRSDGAADVDDDLALTSAA